jgi:hypothetical protein
MNKILSGSFERFREQAGAYMRFASNFVEMVLIFSNVTNT